MSEEDTESARVPVCAVFLAKFDVHTGFALEWSQTLDDSVPLKNLEYKALPSGLHNVEHEVIAFIQPRESGSIAGNDGIYYGLAAFRQNLSPEITAREDVRMYSVGVLVDPKHLMQGAIPKWRPTIYSSTWLYKKDLNKLLKEWMTTGDYSDFSAFEKFFEENKLKDDRNDKFRQIVRSVQQGRKSGIEEPILNHKKSIGSMSSAESSNHMLLYLFSLLDNLGPLIFPVWKAALLRKKILFDNANASIEQTCAYNYCVSILSSIPVDISVEILKSGSHAFQKLEFLQPLYTLGVNDMTLLQKFEAGFVANTSDSILFDKTKLYDVCVELRDTDNDESIPKVGNGVKATQRDYRKFAVLSELISDDKREPKEWMRKVTEPTSFKEFAWSGFSWWATAGENSKRDNELNLERELVFKNFKDFSHEPGEYPEEIERVLGTVGYFQDLTIKIFSMVVDLINNQDEEQVMEDDDQTRLVEEDDKVIWISPNDISEMGLDPYSASDAQFVVDLVRVWFDRKAAVGSYLGLCCF